MKTRKRSRKADVVLSVIVLLLVTFGGYVWWKQLQFRRELAALAYMEAASGPVIRSYLGPNIELGWFVSGRINFWVWPGRADLIIPISGTHGHGKLTTSMKNDFAGWHICSMKLSLSNGKEVTLTPEQSVRSTSDGSTLIVPNGQTMPNEHPYCESY
ncbi:MAG: cytochrome c oxidase assembly factor Coa1 family protein [Bryocella sp.]